MLKRHLIEKAREREVLTLVSFVHQENKAMLDLNAALGATVRPDPNDVEQVLYMCTIDPLAPLPTKENLKTVNHLSEDPPAR